MRIENLQGVEAFVTKDGSEIRELAGVPTGNSEHQSLAEATVPPGGETEEHYHRASEEIYFFTHGRGRLRLDDEESEVAVGDTVVIPPGSPHSPLSLRRCSSTRPTVSKITAATPGWSSTSWPILARRSRMYGEMGMAGVPTGARRYLRLPA